MRKLLSLCLLAISLAAYSQTEDSHFYRGADLGWITEIEHRRQYQIVDTAGNDIEAYQLMRQMDVDAVRIRVWVNPRRDADGNAWCDIPDVVAKAIRARDAGMSVMIDFHYSNWWADPSQQHVPREWAAAAKGRGDSTEVVCDSMRAHTIRTLTALKRAGVEPRWIQVGNETPNGFMHPYGDATLHPEQFARLFQVGYDACKSVFPHAKVIVHIDNGYDLARTTFILDLLRRYSVRFDMVGWSLYPAMNWVTREVDANWQRKVDQCFENSEAVFQRYQCESMLVEVGMPDTDERIGSSCISYILQNAPSHIHGLFWWEPLATPDFHYSMGALKSYGGNRYGPNEALKAFRLSR